MKHYPIEQWADYLRGLVNETASREMTSHLAARCEQCQRTLERLRATSSGLAEVEVPESFLARARAIFPPALQPISPVRRLLALLTFDSLGSAVPQGIRSAAPSIRRLAYSVEDFSVELLVDPGKIKGTVVITGQISISNATEPVPLNHHIRLVARKHTLHRAEASDLGEFQLEFLPRPGLRLVILDTAANRQIEVSLDPVQGNRRASSKSSSETKSNPSEA